MQKQLGIQDFYKFYKEQSELKKRKAVDYDLYSKIIKEVNLRIKDLILQNETVKLPYCLGDLKIVKFENKFNIEKQYKWKVDFKKTKELGYKVYYGSKYGYRWKWDRINAKVEGQYLYHFKPVRDASRAITVALNNNIEFR